MVFNKKNKQPADRSPADRQESPQVEMQTLPSALSEITHIVAVASGKGGVGKSTVSVNLAAALKDLGYSVGLMDADIYGPSQPNLLGAAGSQAEVTPDQQLKPSSRHGIDFVSIGLLMDEDKPVIWRAPIATRMIMQFIGAVQWGKRDFLIIDLPPGTGDVQLTLSQQAALTGSIIVTTPQKVALDVAKKGLQMFEQVSVPILGVIENMSGYACRHCGETTHVFGQGGGSRLAEANSVPFLASIPLDPQIMLSGEEGVPVVVQDKLSPASQAFIKAAKNLVATIENEIGTDVPVPEQVLVVDSGALAIEWKAGATDTFSPYDLRIACPCAACVDEETGRRTLDPTRVSPDIRISSVKPVGRYGLAIGFSDDHSSGIYTFDRLRSINETKAQSFEL